MPSRLVTTIATAMAHTMTSNRTARRRREAHAAWILVDIDTAPSLPDRPERQATHRNGWSTQRKGKMSNDVIGDTPRRHTSLRRSLASLVRFSACAGAG